MHNPHLKEINPPEWQEATWMLLQEASKSQFVNKAIVQWKLDKFFRVPVALAGPIPKNPLDLITGFKINYDSEILKNYWKRLRGGEHYDPTGDIMKIGMIYDPSQQVALVINEAGVECLNLRGILASPGAHVEHKTEREIQAGIRHGKQSGNAISIGNNVFQANLFELLIKNLKTDWMSGEEGYYSIGIHPPQKNNTSGSLLIVRNNVTLMLGVLASMNNSK
ncbi:MAG: hypothetical protein RBG13Loki_2172 [Promethearchaeota archaeon CR_4]|nr:MAG: hypothetical protein RBG13Loki_2172 [Candidatus Lokiarchaeota archaeon CR_4]